MKNEKLLNGKWMINGNGNGNDIGIGIGYYLYITRF